MIQDIIKYQKTTKNDYTFSVLIPSWNNIDYLKICINSIFKNSHYPIQIIVIVNEGKDQTLEWLKQQAEIDVIYSPSNIGICYALNIARGLVKAEYIVYVNDDMYLLPNWDVEFLNEIKRIGNKSFMLSGTMIEPINTNNQCVIVKDYGGSVENFNELSLLNDYSNLYIKDWSGSMWPPNVVHIDLWDLVGGMSIEYSPGMYSDPDFARKLFEVGVRNFKGKGNSLAYHFGSKSTKRVKQNKGKKTFLIKWGITPRVFMKEYLKLGNIFDGSIHAPVLSRKTKWINKVKKIWSC